MSFVNYGFCFVYAQDIEPNQAIKKEKPKNRFLLDATFRISRSFVKNETGNIKELKSLPAPGFMAGIAYQYQLNQKNGLEFFLGHGTLNTGNKFEMDEEDIEGLYGNLFDSDFYNDGFPLQLTSIKIEHLYRFKNNEKSLFSLKSGVEIKSNWFHYFNRHENGKIDASSYGGSIQNVNNDLPAIEYYDYAAYFTRLFHVNPVVTLRYEYINSYGNMLGFSLKAVSPFLPIVRANIEVFPEHIDAGGSFEQIYYGGYLGLSCSFSF